MTWQWEHAGRAHMRGGRATSWLTFPAADGLIAAYRVIEEDGDLVAVELRMFAGDFELGQRLLEDPAPADPFDTSQPIRPKHVRALPVSQHLAAIREIMNPDHSDAVGATWAWLGYVSPLMRTAPARTGRRRVPEAVYLAAAILYAHAVEIGERAPNRYVAEGLRANGFPARGPPYTVSYIRSIVHEARRQGLLTQAAQGRAGGSLTPLALEARRKLLGAAETHLTAELGDRPP